MRKLSQILLTLIFALPMLFGGMNMLGVFSNASNLLPTTSNGGGGGNSLDDPSAGKKTPENSEEIVIKAWQDNIADAFAGGKGTKSDPYLISTPAQLAYLGELTETGGLNATRNKYYELTNDIIINDGYFEEDGTYHDGGDGVLYTWRPIGYYADSDATFWNARQFRGNFDGKNHVVSGIYINSPTQRAAGLFGLVFDGGCVNLSLKNSYYNVASGGAIIGVAYERTIKNLTNYTNINNPSGSFSGVIGIAYYGIIENCVNYGNISAKADVSGIAKGSSIKQVINCINYGNLSGNRKIAGIMNGRVKLIASCNNYGNLTGYNNDLYSPVCGIGMGDGSTSSMKISNCNNYGAISGCAGNAGIGARLYLIENCNNYGVVQGVAGSKDTTVGIGYEIDKEYYIKNCRNFGSIKGESRSAGIASRGIAKIDMCINFGDVFGSNGAGGIFGTGMSGSTISNSENRGNVSGNVSNVGGIIGYGVTNRGIKIKNSLNIGKIFRQVSSKQCSSISGGASTGFEVENVISVCSVNGIECAEYFGTDFSGFYYSWKLGKIGLVAFDGRGSFQGKIDEEWLLNNDYEKKSI